MNQWLLAALAGGVLCLSSFGAGDVSSVITGWLASALFMALWFTAQRPVLAFFVSGLVFQLSAFYWLPITVIEFGGLSVFLATFLFLLFSIFCALQFAITAYIAGALSRYFDKRSAMAFALAWFAVEYLFPSFFPWRLGYSQLSFSEFAATADLFGIYLISFLMLWWSGTVIRFCQGQEKSPRVAVPMLIASALCIGFIIRGHITNQGMAQHIANSDTVSFALVQGNISTQDKHDIEKRNDNLAIHKTLSQQALANGARLIVWPESASNTWIWEGYTDAARFDLDFTSPSDEPYALLTGSLSFTDLNDQAYESLLTEVGEGVKPDILRRLKRQYFNSVVLIEAGNINARYDKRVLMPITEYIPLIADYPALLKYLPVVSKFDKGTTSSVIPLTSLGNDDLMPKAGILICYEDLVPQLSLDAVSNGANILINVTNDAWFGNSFAPHQHNLLAAWRAVETRRFLLRTTNTGLTVIINPYGEFVDTLPLFEQGVLQGEAAILNHITTYTLVQDWPTKTIVAILFILALLSKIIKVPGSRLS